MDGQPVIQSFLDQVFRLQFVVSRNWAKGDERYARFSGILTVGMHVGAAVAALITAVATGVSKGAAVFGWPALSLQANAVPINPTVIVSMAIGLCWSIARYWRRPMPAQTADYVGVERWELTVRLLTASALIFIPWLFVMWLLH